MDIQSRSALTATEAAAEIARGAFSAEDYARACLQRITELDGNIHAFVHFDPDHVIAQAKALDERRASGQPLGPLHGLLVGVKDIFDTADYPTECGSAALAGRRPWHDATVVAKLRAAGAVIVKTVTTEFAFFHPGPTRNPHDPERTPGGSSSGSAAAVGSGMLPLAIGSQTNGSVIRPAAFCGVYGMKPTHGTISRAGALELSRTLDHVGGFARSLPDLGLLLEAIAGHDPADPDTRPVAAARFARAATETAPLPQRFAFVRTPKWEKAAPETQEGFAELVAALGDAVVPVDLPERYAAGWDAQRTIMAVEMAHGIGPIADRGGERISGTFHALVEEGRAVTATRYLAAIAEGRRLADDLGELFNDYNAIITPATAGVAPKGITATGDPAFCTLWTLLGLPALSVPLLTGEQGLPIGVQLVGPRGGDARLLQTANWLTARLALSA